MIDSRLYKNTEEDLKNDSLEKDMYFISELKKTYDMACKDKTPAAMAIGMLINMHLMRLSEDDRKVVMKKCGIAKTDEEK